MPLYNYKCPNGHIEVERYIHASENRDSHVEQCSDCDAMLTRAMSVGMGLTYYRENRGRWIENIGPEPEFITSHGAWREALKRNNREWVGARRGEPGAWT